MHLGAVERRRSAQSRRGESGREDRVGPHDAFGDGLWEGECAAMGGTNGSRDEVLGGSGGESVGLGEVGVGQDLRRSSADHEDVSTGEEWMNVYMMTSECFCW